MIGKGIRGILLGVFVTLTIGGGYVVAGLLSDRQLTVRDIASLSDGGIRSDGWLRETAEISFEGLSTRGNVLNLRLSPDRPVVGGAPRVAYSVCGGPESVVSVVTRDAIAISLQGECSPRSVVLRGLDSFMLQEGDTERRLSVQVLGAEISSSIGVPILEWQRVASFSGAMALIGILALLALRSLSVWALCFVICCELLLVGGVSLSGLAVDKLLPVWVMIVATLTGMVLFAFSATPQPEGRATPEESTSRVAFARVVLCAILLLAAALRVYGITFGLPANYHPDEVPKVNAIMRMVDQNTLNPQYFLHPSLLLYSTYAMNTLFHIFGMEGTFRETAFLAGRSVSMVAGIISVLLTYLIGVRLISRRVGLVAALLLAVFPLHVTCSRYLKEDSLLTCMILFSTWLTLVAVQSSRRWVLPLAGFIAGCAAGSKYSGILTIIIPLSAPWLASRSLKPDVRWFGVAVCALLCAPVGFVATTPYAVLDSTLFLKGFRSESNHMQNGHSMAIDPWSQAWMYHMWRSVIPGASLVVTLIGVAGLGYLFRQWRIYSLFIVGAFVLFYLPAEYVQAKPAPQPERYILPCLPFLALAAGVVLDRLVELMKGAPTRSAVFACASLALACIPLFRSVELARDIRPDTRDKMAQWMRENVPEGAVVLMDWKPYCPRLDERLFEVRHIPRADIILELDLKRLKASGAQYLILSSMFYGRYFSQPEANPAIRQRLREVFERIPVVTQFTAEGGSYGFHNPILTLFSLKPEDFERLAEERAQKQRGEIQLTSNDVRAQKRW